ncbi:Uncharacterised protein [Mycobacteroides abscessus subsp. massiliense]|nr:Uncharacterised protein [Mycobacteroides abscessus subsp. massiliense]
MKLEPTAEQLELIAKAAGVAVWEMQIAFDIANRGIPEGAPVGTIARRPDGAVIAVRGEKFGHPFWTYKWLDDGPNVPTVKDTNDADSWPVIYDPDEYHEGDKPRLERLMREPSVFDAVLLREAATRLAESSTEEKDNYHLVNDLLDAAKRLDPTAQQEPKPCRICNGSGIGYGKVPGGWLETDCAACDATGEAQQEPVESLSRGLDDIADGRVSRRDDYLEPQQEPEEDDKPEGCTECGFTAYELEDGRCDQCPPPKPRTPRVVDRLGVDERDAEWTRRQVSRDIYVWEYRFRGGVWQFRLLGHENWAYLKLGEEPANGPFTEVLEPRVLQSLDCEEARDGTVWEARYVLLAGREQTPGWKFQHTQDGWVYEDGSRVLSPEFLTGRGPYTEVLGDPS